MPTSRIVLAAFVATLIASPAVAEGGCGFRNETADRQDQTAMPAPDTAQTPIPAESLATLPETTDAAVQPPRTATPAKSE